MPTGDSAEAVRRQIESEREQLVETIEALKVQADLAPKLRDRLPLLVAGGLVAGFVAGGGVGATARLVMRRSREGKEKARIGRFAFAARR